jgi:hypothetical protein
MRNEILESVVRHQWKDQELEDWKKKRQLHKDQRFTYDTPFTEYNNLEDKDIGGVTELAIIETDPSGNQSINRSLNGSVVIGGKEHTLQAGTLRVIDKKAVDENLNWIVEQRRFKDSIMSAIMSDRSGRIARQVLPKSRYNMLKSNDPTFVTLFKGEQNISGDIVSADGRPEMFMLYHESSKEFALALHKLSLVVDNTELTFSEGIDDWNTKFRDTKQG